METGAWVPSLAMYITSKIAGNFSFLQFVAPFWHEGREEQKPKCKCPTEQTIHGILLASILN